jgi:hypothetical protein
MGDDHSYLSRMSPAARARFLPLIREFLDTQQALSEQAQLAARERELIDDPDPLKVAQFFASHAAHAAKVAELQMRTGEVAAEMAAVLQGEFGTAPDS